MKHIFDDADKNKYEAYTKQEVLEVIQEAISSGELPEEINGLVLTFKNPVDNQAYKIAFCTQAKYNELVAAGQIEENCYYFITDDSSFDDLENAITTLQTGVNQHTSEIEDIKQDITEIESDITSLDGRVDTLEGIHLYKHDIKIRGTGFSAIFTIYTNSADVLDTASKIGAYMKSGTGDLASPSINAGGYVADNNNICNIQYVFYSSGSLTASYTRYNNGSWDSYNQSLSTGTIYDGVTQIF